MKRPDGIVDARNPASRKRSPATLKRDLARAARHTARQIETAASDRQVAYADGGRPNTTERLARDLDRLHGDKRALRRVVLDTAPALDRQVYRRTPGAGA